MAQSSASWTFYNPDNIKHQGTQTDHTIVVKTRTAPTLADINNDGKLEMIYGGQNTGDWDYYYHDIDGETKWGWGWNSDYNNSGFVIGFNGTLILLGALGVLAPAASALLHNTSTLLLSMHSMTGLMEEEKRP